MWGPSIPLKPINDPALIKRYGAHWRFMRSKYNGPEFFAVAPTPENSGDRQSVQYGLFSAIFQRGWRTYAFAQEALRDDFVDNTEFAVKTGDPIR